jgi:DNA-binding GntR family transcriptional regulator
MGLTEGYDDGSAASGIMRLQAAPLLRQEGYDALEELIIYGSLAPGQHLAETELASRLAVSRNPVREALPLLHREGWLDLEPRQGAFVHAATVKEVDDVFDIREILEVESARRAAHNVTPAAITLLRERLAAGRAALERGEERELIGANASFHATVAELADNRMLAQLLSSLDKRVRWYFAPVAQRRRRDS